ncbi:alpha/beta hydrolase [Rhodococcus sp. USK13]|uniref:alpha/beta hydrolase n=1 Tax=Rhodococcus sp. USK13 TaxID=2806442 RepID=UPI001BD1297D|nr:alpha/beta hydrolase [Rhodococcus sp. USK13]
MITETIRLKTADGATVSGVLRIPDRGAETVVTIMHPREDVTHHSFVSHLTELGVAVWTQGTRSVNNDIRLLHEQALLDVAAGQSFLADRKFESRVTLGHSGGATLFAFYQQQARLPIYERLTEAPDGTTTDLGAADMPVPDGAIFVAPHPGQGILLQRVIDPSVVNESDPWLSDGDLDPYRPANGFRPAPEESRYSPDFIERYRSAQVARIRRIDELAQIAVQETHRMRAFASASGDANERRRSLASNIMVVHRTDADLRSVDLTLDRNDRPYGSLFGSRPDLGNFGFAGFCRITTPAAWMSTWSATTSRANFVRNVAGVTSPALLVELTGDQACFPADARDMYSSITAQDKKHVRVAGTHFGGPLTQGGPTGTELAFQQIARWLRERFSTAAV